MSGNVAKVAWNQHPLEDDIAYRGPLSYRHFKVIGWLLFVTSMLIPALKLAASMDSGLEQMLVVPLGIMESVAPLSVTFLLVADFSRMLVEKDYQKQMLINGGAALGLIVVTEALYHRYVVGSVDAFVQNRSETLGMCDAVFSSLNPSGFIAFNVFVDLFLCACVMFFLNYEPTKYLTGENRKWFRSLVILPVVFELGCLWLKLTASSGSFHVPISVFPFLTTKPPMMFFAFCALIFYEARHEEHFCAGGRTHEEYVAYLGTNRNSWQFAKVATVVFLVAGLIDTIAVASTLQGDWDANIRYVRTLSKADQLQWYYSLVDKYVNAGFGGAADLVLFAPLMLLFNYTKRYENEYVEYLIPVGAITLLIVLYLEGGLIAMGAAADITRNEIVPAIEEVVDKVQKVEEDIGKESLAYIESVVDDALRKASESGGAPANAASDGERAKGSDEADEVLVRKTEEGSDKAGLGQDAEKRPDDTRDVPKNASAERETPAKGSADAGEASEHLETSDEAGTGQVAEKRPGDSDKASANTPTQRDASAKETSSEEATTRKPTFGARMTQKVAA